MKFHEYLNYQFPDDEIIHHSHFLLLSDFYFYGIKNEHDWWANKIRRNKKIYKIKRTIKDRNSVLYCYGDTDQLPHCFNLCKSHPNINYIIILTRTDHSVSKQLIRSIPSNITLFTHNVMFKHARIIALPYGVKCDKDDTDNWIGKYQTNSRKRKLLYCNFSIKSHKGYENRKKIYRRLKRQKWITFDHMGSFLKYSISQAQYYDQISRHKFTLSPRGGGIDCYRTWEALYLKSIPIVEKSDHWSYFKDLPILIVDNYNNLSKEFLNTKYDEISKKDFNVNKLTLSYWKELINKILKK